MTAHNFIAINGQRFGRWTVTALAARRRGQARWHVRCDCGNESVKTSAQLRAGITRSCGCLRREVSRNRHFLHGAAAGTRTPTYRVWRNMRQRCENPRNPEFANYGGRGIVVCERWQRFQVFLADMGERPAGMSIERIDNDRGYEPGNCRWATPSEQAQNTRVAHRITFRGETRTLTDWCRVLGIDRSTAQRRIARGWKAAEALAGRRGA